MAIWEEYEEEEDIGPIIYRRRPESKSVVSVQRSRSWIVAEEEDDDDDDDDLIPIKVVESDEMICSRHYKCIFGRNCIAPNTTNGPLTVLVNQTDVLNCPICLDLLSTPIFQCENGDIVCSSCHSKLKKEKKCPFCLMSIDNNRCRGLEKFIESISKISCKNAVNGCKKALHYNKKSEHEETCPYAYCTCPYPSCYYPSLSKKVYAHFGIEHTDSIIGFTYDTTFSVSVDIINQKRENHMLFLQEQNESVVFILNHQVQEQGQGGVFYVEFVGPGSLKHKFIYQLTAETVDSSLSLKSVPEMYKWSSSSPTNNYITVPSGFSDSNGFLSLSICINKRISSNFDQEVGEEFGNEYDLSNGAIKVVVVLTNPDVLNCSICLHPLFTPCFQYEKGNIVCSLCCSKVEKKCPKCFPIGDNYNRCRGLEKVTESIMVLCKNAGYGCEEKLPYNVMSNHEETCGYDLCFCPHPSCPFAGTHMKLYLHFGIQHAAVITGFTYDTTFSLSVDINENHMFLQEQRQSGRGAIFILNHQVQEHGRAFYLDCVSPNIVNKCLMYQLSAKSMEKTVFLKSVPEILTKWSNHSPPKNYLTVPSDFASYNDPLSLSICISKGFEASRWILFGDKCS